MIEFQLDPASGVATYLQLVQQVRQALRLGMLEPGDQLPTAQQVVAKLAINPNTVLKAYRELEREGLVRARPGHGHVRGRRRSRAPTPPRRPAPSVDCSAWLRTARAAGLDPDEHRGDLSTPPFRNRSPRRRRMTAVSCETAGSASGTGAGGRCRDCTLRSRPAGSSGWSARTAPARRPCCTWPSGCWRRPPGRSRCSAARPAGGPAQLARVGFVAQDTPDLRRLSASPTTCAWARGSTRPGTRSWREQRIERLGLDPRAEGRHAVRRPAGAARADAGHRQAARAADPRRAGRQPRPARPARVPAAA